MHDFLDNLGAQQYEKIMEKNATKEEIINTCEETYGKEKCHEETYYNSQKPKAKSSKPKRKKLPPEEMHPFPTFPYRLEYQDGNDTRVCHFECEEHRTKHIQRYKLRKGKYFIDNFT